MAKYQVILKLSTLTLCLSCEGAAFAISLSDAQAVERTANRFAIANDFKSSFRAIREMIEKAEASGNNAAAEVGYRFLRERQLIANEALEGLTPKFIASTVCKDGFDKGMSKINEILNTKISATAQSEVIAEKTALLKYSNNIFGAQKEDACQSESLLAAEDKIKADLEREQQQALDKKNAAELAERIKLAPSFLRNNDDIRLCRTYGLNVIGKSPDEFSGVKNLNALIQSELNRRRLSVDKNSILEGKIRIGSSECTVYASWGRPSNINRNVGAGGERKQLVYESISKTIYIYTNNGRVDSFQD